MLIMTTRLSLILAALCLAPVAGAQSTPEREVGPGVFWSHQVLDGPLNVNVVRFDLSHPSVTLEAEPGKNVLFQGETTVDTAARESDPQKGIVVAAVNGDFWRSETRLHRPVGMLVSDGMLHTLPGKDRAVLVMTETEKVTMQPVTMKIRLEHSSGKSFSINSLNHGRTTESVTLFTEPYGKEVKPDSNWNLWHLDLENSEFLPNRPVSAVLTDVPDTSPVALSAGRMVLAIPHTDVERSGLRAGEKVRLVAEVPEVDGVITAAIGGAPRILIDGKPIGESKEDGGGKSFSETRHPRTAVGISEDGKTGYLVTVDGRQPSVSIGIGLRQLGEIMRNLGCYNAMNLDGGGSTSMVVNGEVVNKPSDRTGPRRVANSLLVVASPGSGQLVKMVPELLENELRFPAGARVRIGFKGADESGFPVDIPRDGKIAVNSSAVRLIDADHQSITLQLPSMESNISLGATLGKARAQLNIQAMVPKELIISPDVVVLKSGEEQELEVKWSDGTDMHTVGPEMVELSATGAGIKMNGTKVTGVSAATGSVTVSVGRVTKEIPYFVDSFRRDVVASFDNPTWHTPLTGTNWKASLSSVTPAASNVEGAGAVKVQYAMAKGGPSRVFIPVNEKLFERPARLGISISGDNKQAWVRALLIDAVGMEFLADFTDGGKGVYWGSEWKEMLIPFSAVKPVDTKNTRPPAFPVIIKHVYIGQDQEALKANGSIGLDALTAIYPAVAR